MASDLAYEAQTKAAASRGWRPAHLDAIWRDHENRPGGWCDHPRLWWNREGQLVLTAEPYQSNTQPGVVEAWAAKNGWTLERSADESPYFPGQTCLIILTAQRGQRQHWGRP